MPRAAAALLPPTALLCVSVGGAVATGDYAAYGPLQGLVGTWHGIQGKVRNPRPNRYDCYTERLTFSPMFPVHNKDIKETVYALRYEVEAWTPQGTPLHHEVGEWQWHPQLNRVLRAAVVPRGQTFQALGTAETTAGGATSLHVSAGAAGVVNSPAFAPNVRLDSFTGAYHLQGNTLWYNDTSVLDYNGAKFEHSDANCLARSTGPQGPAGWSCPGVAAELFCTGQVGALPAGAGFAPAPPSGVARSAMPFGGQQQAAASGSGRSWMWRWVGMPAAALGVVAAAGMVFARRGGRGGDYFTEL